MAFKTTYYPDEVLEKIFDSVTSNQDRNSISLVCKSWFKVERWSRRRVFIGNCYSISPERVVARFPKANSLSLKGRPRFADFDSVPRNWGGVALPWIQAIAESYPGLEELRLKRMVVSDGCLELISRAFGNFKSLVLVSCEGFTTDGLAAIAANCRFLRELDLQENDIEDSRGHWLSCFPETYTSLVSLNFACLEGQVNLGSLEKLVARCRNLKQLKVNHTVPIRVLLNILKGAPQLEDLGVGLYRSVFTWAFFIDMKSVIGHCKWIRSLSGIIQANKVSLSLLYPICENLTTLNLSYAPGISEIDFMELIQHCKCLQRLWVLDSVGDQGLGVVGSNCKELCELKVFPSPYGAQHASITEEGLVAVSIGCSKLHSLQYFCQRMTNAALITVAKNCPNFTRFSICMPDPQKPDHVTLEALDEGFGAIIQSCKSLKRLSLSGFLTEQVFLYIGMYGEQLEVLSVAFAGGSSIGMQYVLKGCRNLRKLEIKNSHFGDDALLEEVGTYERMRSLWMSSCDVTLRGCESVAKKMATLNVEIINKRVQAKESFDDATKVEKIYMYRTLAGPRRDAPEYVWNL